MALPRGQCGFVAGEDFLRCHAFHSPSKERRVVKKSGMPPSKPRAEVAMVPGRPRSARARLSKRVSEAAASAAGEGGGALAADTGAGATKAGTGLGGGMIFGFGALKRPPMRASPEKGWRPAKKP
jgi:hypothetical protein